MNKYSFSLPKLCKISHDRFTYAASSEWLYLAESHGHIAIKTRHLELLEQLRQRGCDLRMEQKIPSRVESFQNNIVDTVTDTGITLPYFDHASNKRYSLAALHNTDAGEKIVFVQRKYLEVFSFILASSDLRNRTAPVTLLCPDCIVFVLPVIPSTDKELSKTLRLLSTAFE